MSSVAIALGLSLVACGSSRSGNGDDDPGPDAPNQPFVDEHFVTSSTIGALGTDAERLYFVDDDSLKSMPLAGGTAMTLYTMPAPGPVSLGGIESIVVGDAELAIIEAVYDVNTGAEQRTLRLVSKSGGAQTMLATSADSRAFLGVTFDGDFILYSSFTSVLRVPRAGGTVQFVGESDGLVDYWIFSPVAKADSIFWAAGQAIYSMARSESKGTSVAEVPAFSSKIVGEHDGRFVVALSPDVDFLAPASSFIEVDPTTGATTSAVALGDGVQQVTATSDAVYAATFTGLVRVSLAGGVLEHLTTASGMYVAVSAGAVYASSGSGIARIVLN